jgi:hypothetical protein
VLRLLELALVPDREAERSTACPFLESYTLPELSTILVLDVVDAPLPLTEDELLLPDTALLVEAVPVLLPDTALRPLPPDELLPEEKFVPDDALYLLLTELPR